MKHHLKSFLVIVILGILTILIAVLFNSLKLGVQQTNQEQEIPQPVVTSHPDISITNVAPSETLVLPFTVAGTVKGTWFFEGSFPVFIKDTNNVQLGYGLASSTSDWMTVNQIPFTVTLPNVNYQGPATLVFTKDNPSGEPQFDDSYSINVVIQ